MTTGPTLDYFGSEADVAALEAEVAAVGDAAAPGTLVPLAWYLRERDPPRAIELSEKAQRASAAALDTDPVQTRRIEARALLIRAYVRHKATGAAETLSLVAEVRRAFEAIGDATGLSDACMLGARAATAAGDIQLRSDLVAAAIQAGQDAGDAVREHNAMLERVGYTALRDVATASRLLQECLDRAPAIDHPGFDMQIEFGWAMCAATRGDHARAVVHFRRCYDRAVSVGALNRAALCASNAAATFISLNDFASALECADLALGIARPKGLTGETVTALYYAAEALRCLGRPGEARALTDEAKSLVPIEGRTSHNWAVRANYDGRVALDLGEFDEALRSFRTAEEIARRTQSISVLAMSLHRQALALSHLGRVDEAVKAVELSLQACDTLGDLSIRSETLHTFSEVARAHALPLPPQATAPNAAIHYLEAALTDAAKCEGHALSAQWLAELSRDYESVGDFRHGLALAREAATAREAIHSRKASDLATSLHVRHETERARAEAAHHKALAEAEAARAEAEAARADAQAAANQAKSAFLANMSHELRSPLNAMLGFTRLLLREPQLSEQAQGDLAIVSRSGEHLYGLINQVLEVSKVEAGRVSLTESECDLYALLDELSEMFAPALRAKGLQWQVENDAEVPQYIQTDAVKLRQVLINLLSNAVKFTQRGAIELRVGVAAGAGVGTGANAPAPGAAAGVRTEASAAASTEASSEAEASPEGLARVVVSFAVTDTGAGIAAEEMSQLGTAFYQAQAGRRAAEGTGLGLTISRSFVRLMGGELRLSSTVGEGTRAHFELPVQVLAAPLGLRAAVPRRRVVGLAAGSGRPRILAVDDRAESRLLLVRLLRPLGFEVREASNGQEALALWEQWRPQLILMDMRMPVLGGREATRRIKATEAGQATCVIALTASSFEEQREEMLALGCDDFLRKPFREEVLLELLGRQLGVEFVYEEAPAPVGGEAEVDAQRLARLPTALREQLQAAVEQLDVPALDAALDATRPHDAAAAAALTLLAKRFQYERIRELLLNA